MRIYIHPPDSLNEFPTFARISLDDVINFIQPACERIPLNRIDCEPIKIDPSFSYFSTRSLSNIMYISNWLSHSHPLPSLIAITCTALCCRISKQSPQPRLLVLKLLHMPIY